jgi:hypothetical protein
MVFISVSQAVRHWQNGGIWASDGRVVVGYFESEAIRWPTSPILSLKSSMISFALFFEPLRFCISITLGSRQ